MWTNKSLPECTIRTRNRECWRSIPAIHQRGDSTWLVDWDFTLYSINLSMLTVLYCDASLTFETGRARRAHISLWTSPQRARVPQLLPVWSPVWGSSQQHPLPGRWQTQVLTLARGVHLVRPDILPPPLQHGSDLLHLSGPAARAWPYTRYVSFPHCAVKVCVIFSLWIERQPSLVLHSWLYIYIGLFRRQ